MPPSVDEIARLVSLLLGAPTVTGDSYLVEDLGAESADLVNIVATAEERYGVRLDETALGRVRTVADLHALVSSQL